MNWRFEMVNNSSSSSSSSTGGIGFVGALTIAFIVLKLTGVINWSWWWVLSPIWITTVFILGVIFGGFLIYVIYKAVRGKK